MATAADRLLALIFPLLRTVFPPHPAPAGAPRRILVTELWHIGDLVVALPFLAALRERFPGARIALLAKGHAREVLSGSGFVDEVITHDFPWSYEDIEGRPRRLRLRETIAVIRRLRRERFDLAFDCSRDGRNHLLLFVTGAARRVGFDFGGGARLLTDALPADSLDEHRTADWLRLLEPFGGGNAGREPRLAVSAAEREWAVGFLRSNGLQAGGLLV
ncbi:MAG: hypothetical protein NUW01_05030, partial [Gemmatimonadaceae bacterium]|nr:hypothetical protein [Gemmatimonadaceae bacterium]